jgi:TnpA family transposase
MTNTSSQAIQFTPQHLAAIHNKYGGQNQLIFATMLIFFEKKGAFSAGYHQTPEFQKIMRDVSKSLQIELVNFEENTRSIERFKQEIRFLTGFRRATLRDQASFLEYCKTGIFPSALTWDQALEQAYSYLQRKKLEPYSEKRLHRLVAAAHHDFETEFFKKVTQGLSLETRKHLDQLLENEKPISNSIKKKIQKISEDPVTLAELKSQHVDLKNYSIFYELQKYKYLQTFNLPQSLADIGTRKLFLKYYERVLIASPSHLKSHSPSIRYAYLASFCYIREQMTVDTLTNLLLKLLHLISKKAENFVDKSLKLDNKRVTGKMGTLLVLAQTSQNHPKGIIEKTIYPTVSQERLSDIIQDLGCDFDWYQNLIKEKALSLYSHNNHRMIWALIEALEFGAGPECSRSITALNFLKRIHGCDPDDPLKKRLYDPIIIQKLVPESWVSFITLKDPTYPRKVQIHWKALELALFDHLKLHLPLKNIWVKNSYLYCDPQKDMPADFYENMDYYFNLFKLPKEFTVFKDQMTDRLDDGLQRLNDTILQNSKVVIKKRGKKGSIKITPFDPQIEPPNLNALKREIAKLWPHLNLIDILKEVDDRVQFTKRFESAASREAIPEQTLRKRLLLCLFGMGTNTGLKRMSGISENHEYYDNLRYVKKRFITPQTVRAAIQDVINAIHIMKDPRIWGVGKTLCAGDSKKISVWDQNLLVEWHSRYGGRGVMIYWHVKDGLCVHSNLKTCSSSEVAAMIRGVLYHDTLMDLDKISVDTHGQSSIGFALSELLSFDLLPRIKDINKQKLYASSHRLKKTYKNLTDALASEIIHWDKIEPYYHEMVRYAAALKMRTVEPEVMMKCLSANNKSNPIYQALLELGKASRTIFLCQYLSSEEVRIEIHEALNTVERVNGIMEFIFYGRLGEISNNNPQDQALSLLCLHLLQACMGYINTILVQNILSDSKWFVLLTKEDFRALSPLFHAHINPYGLVALNMNRRIDIDLPRQKVAAQ